MEGDSGGLDIYTLARRPAHPDFFFCAIGLADPAATNQAEIFRQRDWSPRLLARTKKINPRQRKKKDTYPLLRRMRHTILVYDKYARGSASPAAGW
jgi:hypothetical protein